MKKERERQQRKDQKGRILKKGEGQDKNGRYYYNYFDNTGKRKRIYNLDLIELREQEQEIQKALENCINISETSRTLNEQFEKYMNTRKLKETTKTNYRYQWNKYLKNGIGTKKIKDIKKSDLQLFFSELSKAGKSDKTIINYKNLLSPLFSMALDDEIIYKNPLVNTTKEYNQKSKEKIILSLEQQERLLLYIQNDKKNYIYYPLFVFMLETACRIGEIRGLTWDNIDLKNRAISIIQQIQTIKDNDKCKAVCITPKSDTSIRIIPITNECYKALKKQKELQFSLGIRHDIKSAGVNNFVFTIKNGKPITSNQFCYIIKNIIEKYNITETIQAKEEKRKPILIPYISAHNLRHTACTRLAEKGIDIKVLQVFMGHSSIKMTMDIYNHANKDRIMEEMKRLKMID